METIEEVYELYGMDEMQVLFDDWNQMGAMNLEDLWKGILHGDYGSLENLLWTYMKDNTWGELVRNKELLEGFLVLFLFSAVIGMIALLVEHTYVTEMVRNVLAIGFTMMGIATLQRSFVIAKEALEVLYQVSKVAIPIYLMTMAIASGESLVNIFGQLFAVGIFWIENVVVTVLFPATKLFGIVGMMDVLWLEGKMKSLIGMIKKVVSFSVKSIVCGISAFGYIQNQILSVSVELKNGTVGTLISLIPGLGKLAEESLSMLVGSSVLISRTTGAFVMIILCILCAKPLFQLGMLYLTIQFGQLLASFLLDSILVTGMETAKTTHLMEGMDILSQCVELMMKITFWSICFFMLMIAVTGLK